MKERLGDELADHYLDRDATNVPDTASSGRRATLVLDIDPDNIKARCFLLRLHTHDVKERAKTDRNFSQLYTPLDNLRSHAEWLAARLQTMNRERQRQVKSDLASYYDQMGAIKHAEGQKATGDGNEAMTRIDNALSRANQYESIDTRRRRALSAMDDARRALEATRAAYRQSDADFQKSLEFDPVNTRARELIEQHRSEYQTITNLLNQISDAQRQARGY